MVTIVATGIHSFQMKLCGYKTASICLLKLFQLVEYSRAAQTDHCFSFCDMPRCWKKHRTRWLGTPLLLSVSLPLVGLLVREGCSAVGQVTKELTLSKQSGRWLVTILGLDSPFFSTTVLSKTQLLPCVFGFLKRRIPGKNGNGRYPENYSGVWDPQLPFC